MVKIKRTRIRELENVKNKSKPKHKTYKEKIIQELEFLRYRVDNLQEKMDDCILSKEKEEERWKALNLHLDTFMPKNSPWYKKIFR